MRDGCPMFRYNKAVMSPKNEEARELEKHIAESIEGQIQISWITFRFAVIDNWNAMHARTDCSRSDGTGLLRFAIWGKGCDLDSW